MPYFSTKPLPINLVQQLQKELDEAKEDLKLSVLELESSNENLRTSNKEVLRKNKGIRSVNEDLEDSSEELQSLNEELITNFRIKFKSWRVPIMIWKTC